MSLRTLNFRKPDHNRCVAHEEQASLHAWFVRFNGVFMEMLILKVTMVNSLFSLIFFFQIEKVVSVVRGPRGPRAESRH